MCGFAGFLRLNNSTEVLNNSDYILGCMSAQLAQRGPDDEQFYQDDYLHLVFRRLSINDVADGQQPIWNEDRSVMACVNGEIYNEPELRRELSRNHVFKSHSDSECVVHLFEEHGIDALHKLNAMFAAIIWLPASKQLYLARDRVGVKPLYYTITNGYLIFASELKALLAHPLCPRQIDTSRRKHGRKWFPTFVAGVKQLIGGQFLKAGFGQDPSLKTWWSISENVGLDHLQPYTGSRSDFVAEYQHLVEDSVLRQLRSDVPVGLFLSGGFDSSLIASIAKQKLESMHCFTVDSAPTREVGDIDMAQRVCEYLDFPLHKVDYPMHKWFDVMPFDLDTVEYYLWLIDGPRLQWEWVFKHQLHRFMKATRPDIKVLLLGQGADEFAGGYSSQYHKDYASWSTFEQSRLRRTPKQRRKETHDANERWKLICGTSVQSLQLHNLLHEDRTSAACGVENRVPFLDHRIIEHSLRIPSEWIPDLLFRKKMVRDMTHQRLRMFSPERPKVGFLETGTASAVPRLDIQLAERLFPEFCERYISDSEFTDIRHNMNSKYNALLLSSDQKLSLAQNLLAEMFSMMFQHRLEKTPWHANPPTLSTPILTANR
jgi:asparagine synthase (glutamine-hydrolysing)